ncbi:hypothetical protein B14911_10447 [Bacillus sp. NRRL B-14911]|nr:hypothetical protein B14911_10447 [Bacillus sp. NRRL B-14911]
MFQKRNITFHCLWAAFFFFTEKEEKGLKMKDIKKALMTNQIRLGKHTFLRMEKRGYTRKDIISCIMSGSIVEKQTYNKKPRVLIEGTDFDQQPMAAVIGYDDQLESLMVITVMPPLSHKFKRVI